MELSRRGFVSGVVAAVAAPAIVRPGLIMPIKPALIVETCDWQIIDKHLVLPEPRPELLELLERHVRRSAQMIIDALERDLYGAHR